MKLTSLFPQIKTDKVQVKKTEGKVASADPVVKADSSAADRVDLSSGSRDVRKMKDIIQTTPDVRLEKIQEIKAKIDSGEYSVDPQKVADKMLISLISDTDID